MSNYFKRSLILKSTALNTLDATSAILKIESANVKGLKIDLALQTKLDSESLSLAFYFDNNLVCFKCLETQFAPLTLPSVFCVGIFSDTQLVCFSSCGEDAPTRELLKKEFLNKAQFCDVESKREILNNIYDDERIADINYYDNRLISEDNSDDSKQFDKHDETSREFGKQTQEERNRYKTTFNDNSSCSDKKQNHEVGYFDSVCRELKNIFSRGTRETGLEHVIPRSKWVRINYSSDKYYVVGIIEKDGEPKYICYGVPGVYGSPPEKLKKYASFVPSSLFSTDQNGFYVMFQNAKSGEQSIPRIDIFGI